MQILDSLIQAYEDMANDIKAGNPYQSRDLSIDIEGYEDSRPYFWTRHMSKTGRICFANIVLPEEARGQGIFTKLLAYIEANPHDFTGVEVEQVFEPRLVAHLRRLGWQDDEDERWKACHDFADDIRALALRNGKAVPKEVESIISKGPASLTLWKDWDVVH